MTANPSNMPPHGIAMAKIAAVEEEQDLFWEEQDLFWEEYGQSVDDVETLYKHYERECTSNPQAAATLTLATIMNLEEIGD